MTDMAADILAIITLTARLAQAADDCDLDGYASCLATAVDGGERRAFASASIGCIEDLTWTHHQLMNHIVTVAGERASAAVDVVVDMERTDLSGSRTARVGGRYDLGFVRTDGGWLIDHRVMHRRYVRGDADLVGM
ncbi:MULTISPECIES: nuclear transport factor 2 family protein [unclassified Sphingomonas]|uniref:nuclear transport factor 2 family protein n=1 Tax=unclassified Sphingomonas TaxID=196159 RepID=UPI002269A73F|nr:MULTISPECIES: nuclear transport factor 2 family protein [unclassified Sphingomonas]